MGGISILVWGMLYLLQSFRTGSYFVELQISAIVSLFLFLTILCNQPNFIQREQRRTKIKIKGMHLLMFLWITGGIASFQLIPIFLNGVFNTTERFAMNFFFTADGIFINILHFFMDSVVCRLKDENVRDVLVKVGR